MYLLAMVAVTWVLLACLLAVFVGRGIDRGQAVDERCRCGSRPDAPRSVAEDLVDVR